MALINSPECAKEGSDRKTKRMGKTIQITIMLLLIISLCTGCATAKNTEQGESIQESVKNAEPSKNIQELAIVDHGYSVITSGSNKMYLYYSVLLHNPNADTVAKYSKFRVTAYAEDGGVLGAREEVCAYVWPNGDLANAGQAFELDKKPAKVDLEIISLQDYEWLPITDQTYAPLAVQGVAQNSSGKIMGEVVNPNDYDFERVRMVAIYKDENGRLLGGDFAFVHNLSAAGKVAFEISSGKIEGASFDVYATPEA